jgi:hypothetical protein
MHIRSAWLSVAGSVFALGSACAAESAKPEASRKWNVPRTEHGHPNLQGFWTNATITPLERPADFGERQALTDAEAAALEQREARAVMQAAAPSDLNRDLPRAADGVGNYNNFWFDRGLKVATVNGEKRTSLIVEPKTGRIPAVKPERRAALDEAAQRTRNVDGPEARSLGERCLVFGPSATPPMLSVGYNNHYQIVQTKDAVMILAEMVHDARIVRLNGTHVPSSVRKWTGDSIGRYEGDTLVVETRHFKDQENFRGAGPNRKITERFTRVSQDAIVYRATVEDSDTFAAPWTIEYPFHATNDLIYEYACHEGNYALPGILAGARAQERAAQ